MLQETLLHIGHHYSDAVHTSFKDHHLATFIRHSAIKQIEKSLSAENRTVFEIHGSAGQGQWAKVPWVALFYPFVTRSAHYGYYVVYLFDVKARKVYLSLNQGTTSVFNEFGTNKVALNILRNRAELMRQRLHDCITSDMIHFINIQTRGVLSKGYSAGHCLGYCYTFEAFPNNERLKQDLESVCSAYIKLAYRGGYFPSSETDLNKIDDNELACPQTSIVEKKRYALHAQIERNSAISKFVKMKRPLDCEACGFSFPQFYGELGDDFIEAHHCIPLASLQENIPIQYRREDFALLCANCHRMIHRMPDVSDINTLSLLIKKQKNREK